MTINRGRASRPVPTPEETMNEWTEFRQVSHPAVEAVGGVCMSNSRYEVGVHQRPNGVTYLSIKRQKKEAVHDWRELWRIKNELTDPNREAIELYPGAFRVVDTSNQYHLFVMPLGKAFNLGYLCPDVSDDFPDAYEFNEGRQRPLPGWMSEYRTEPDESEEHPFAFGQAQDPTTIQLLLDLNMEALD